jgi:hypothetical protein
MRIPIPVLACGLLLGTVQLGCAPKNVPRLVNPAHVVAVCGTKQPRLTALLSVMTSTDDIVHSDDAQSDQSVRKLISKTGGVVGYWNDQMLLLPKTASALGETDGYVRVRAAAVTAVPEGLLKHRIYLNVLDHGTPRWIALDAYDVQNPCVEGHLAM